MFHSVASKLYDALRLLIGWHLHKTQGSFCHCSDGSGEDWVCNIVEFLVKITQVNASTLGPCALPYVDLLLCGLFE